MWKKIKNVDLGGFPEMSNTIKIKCQMGFWRRRFRTPGKCQQNVEMPILDGPRKMSNTIEIKCQMGSRRRRFWTLRKMSKILEKCRKSKEHVKSGPKMQAHFVGYTIRPHSMREVGT